MICFELKHNPGHLSVNVKIPHVPSLIETLSWNGSVEGMDNIQAQKRKQYGPGNYIPIVGVEYWSFRLMVGAGMLMALIAVLGIVQMARGKLEVSRRFQKLALIGLALPIVANWMGWIFTKVGRQPWVVFGLLKTSQANSPNVSTLDLVSTARDGARARNGRWRSAAAPPRCCSASPGRTSSTASRWDPSTSSTPPCLTSCNPYALFIGAPRGTAERLRCRLTLSIVAPPAGV